MKLNNSEKNLMIVLIAMLFVFGYYKLIYVSEHTRAVSLRSEKKELSR